MARICKYCGSRNSFGSRYCEECGQKLEVKIDLSVLKKPIVASRNVVKTIILVIIALVLFVLILSSIGSVGKTLDTYYRGVQKNRVSDFMDSFPDRATKLLIQNLSVGDVKYNEFTQIFDQNYAQYLFTYGQDFRIRYNITVKEHWSKGEITNAKAKLFDTWNIPKTSVKKIITVNLNVTIKGEGREQSSNVLLDMIKIYGKWYVYPNYDAFIHPIN